MTNGRSGSLAGLAAALLVAAVSCGQAGPQPQQPLLNGAKDTLAARLEAGLGFDVTLAGVRPGVLRKRLRVQVGDIGTVAEDPVTGVRVLQRRQWQRDPGLMLIEHRLVNGGRRSVQISSVAVADLFFRPRPPGAKTQPAGQVQAPAVHALETRFGLLNRRVSPDAPVEIGPKQALAMFVLSDERNGGGIVLALAAIDAWGFRADLDKAGRLHVRVEVGQAGRAATLEPGESLRLPPIALTAYRGGWARGAAKLRQFWACGYVDKPWEELRDHIGDLCRQATAKGTPFRTRLLLGRANLFVPASMLACEIPAPPAALRGPPLKSTLLSYLSGAWKDELLPDGLAGPVGKALAVVADLQAEIAHLLEDLYLRLLPLSNQSDQWQALQFHSRRHGAGVVLLFRQQSPAGRKVVRLRGLKPAAVYRVWTDTAPRAAVYRGRKLMVEGLPVTLPKDGSCVLRYEILRRAGRRH